MRSSWSRSSASADTVRIYVTNSAGDSIHVIDPATNKVVQIFKGPEAMHGVNFSPDGARVYVSNESQSTLDVFDRKSGKLIKQMPLSNRPNNIAVAKDGRIVVGIARGEGALDIDRPGDADGEEDHPGPRPAAQRLCHAGRQIRHHRLDPEQPC